MALDIRLNQVHETSSGNRRDSLVFPDQITCRTASFPKPGMRIAKNGRNAEN